MTDAKMLEFLLVLWGSVFYGIGLMFYLAVWLIDREDCPSWWLFPIWPWAMRKL